MDQPWQIELFGWLRLVQADRVIARFRTRKTASLLAYLAYYRERSHPRDQLIELLWPERRPPVGRSNLRSDLTSLRRQLEPPGVPVGAVILTDGDTVQLNPAGCVTDVALFEAALTAAERAQCPEARVQQLVTAAERYRGELLPGFFEDWIFPERERLAEAHLQALHTLVALLDELKDRPRALQWARRAVATDPLRAESHEVLIRLLVAAGQFEAARSQYEQGEQLLDRELGASLSPELRALVKDLPLRKDRPAPGPTAEDQTRRQRGREPEAAPAPGTGRILAPDPLPTMAARTHNLPLRFTRFFGREAEVAALCQLVGESAGGGRQTVVDDGDTLSLPDYRLPSTACRLLTLTGSGGTGKTRLALQVAERLRDVFPGGVWFVPLQELGGPTLIPDQVLLALRLPRSPEREPLEQVIAFLSRAPALLLLDNFEHLVDGGAEIVCHLLEQVEHLTILVTSRQRLVLAGEREFPVGPLQVPAVPTLARRAVEHEHDPVAALTQFSSVALFVDRAQAVRPDFQVTAHNSTAVLGLCQRLEGLPLAIELAAARATVLTPQQMLARLERREGALWAMLVTRQRATDVRHRSLWATLDWSYQLLSPDLRRFFAALSVFRGGWTVAAAEAVTAEFKTLEYLEQLRECSMVQVVETAEEMRFHLLETLREYGEGQLASEERCVLGQRHAEFFLALAETAEPELKRPDRDRWLDRLEREHDNLRAALAWSTERGEPQLGLRLGGALHYFWYDRVYSKEGQAQLLRLLEQPGSEVPTAARAKALHALGRFAGMHDQNVERALQEESLAIWRSLGDRTGIADSLCSLGWVLWQQGELSAARASFEESLAIHRELGDRAATAGALNGLGWVAQVEGDMRAARTLLEESVVIWRELGDRRRMLDAFTTLGSVTLDLGDAEAARSLFEELVAGAGELNDKMLIAWGTLYMGQLTKWHEDYAAARALHEESLAMWQELEFHGGLIRTRMGLAAVLRYQGDSAASHAMLTESLEDSRKLGNVRGIIWALACLGDTAADLGDWQQAAARFAESLKMCGQGERGDREPIGICLHGLARLACVQGKPARAAWLLGAAEAVRASMGLCPSPAERREYDGTASAARAQLDEVEFAAAWAEGETMPLGEAIALALEEVAGG